MEPDWAKLSLLISGSLVVLFGFSLPWSYMCPLQGHRIVSSTLKSSRAALRISNLYFFSVSTFTFWYRPYQVKNKNRPKLNLGSWFLFSCFISVESPSQGWTRSALAVNSFVFRFPTCFSPPTFFLRKDLGKKPQRFQAHAFLFGWAYLNPYLWIFFLFVSYARTSIPWRKWSRRFPSAFHVMSWNFNSIFTLRWGSKKKNLQVTSGATLLRCTQPLGI